jgi:hypothetical protein
MVGADLDLDGEGVAARGLRRYVRLVAEAVGVGFEASTWQFHDPVSAYLALERGVPVHPGADLALLWHERHGWALGVELRSGADVDVLGYLAVDVLPPPRLVADYVDRACQGEGTGQLTAPRFVAADLADRLAAYAEPVYDDIPRFLRAFDLGQGPVHPASDAIPAA